MKRLLTFISLLTIFATTACQKPSLNGKITFTNRAYGGDKLGVVYVIDPNSSEMKKVTNDSMNMTSGVISPDGTKLITKTGNDVFIVDMGSGHLKKLMEGNDRSFFSWSPNSTYIAFCNADSNKNYLCINDTSGHDFRRLTEKDTNNYCAYASWLNDSEIVYQGNHYDPFKINIDRPNEPTQITSDSWAKEAYGENASVLRKAPACSPDGKFIAYFAAVDVPSMDRRQNAGIYLVKADGSNRRLIKQSDSETTVWSPDSKYLAHIVFDESGSDVFIMNLKGDIIKKVTPDSMHESSKYGISWSLK